MLVLAAAISLVAVTTGAAGARSADPATPAATMQKPAGTLAFDESSCVVQILNTSCFTATIGVQWVHRIGYRMCAAPLHFADWQIKDKANGVIVAQGRVAANTCRVGYVSGLYGRYWGWVFNTRKGASAYINNA